MTLIIYKNNVLATDSRKTMTVVEKNNKCCIKCNHPANIGVDDTINKIVAVPKHSNIKFRNSKILAIGGSGDSPLILLFQRHLINGRNIESMFENYCALTTTPPKIASILIVTEKNVFVLRTYDPDESSDAKKRIRNFFISTSSRTDTVMIGSGRGDARAIDIYSDKVLSGPELIYHVKLMNDTVGGPIKFVTFKDNQASLVNTLSEHKLVNNKEKRN